MAIETFLIAVLLATADAGAPDCAAIEAKQPALRPLLQGSRALHEAAAKPGASFSRLVAQAKALGASARAQLPQLQAAGCRASEAEVKVLESCTAPLLWSCEAVPPGIDWSFLGGVKRAEDEDLAFALGDVALNGPSNLFATCCGDFGCKEGGVGIPGSFYRDEPIAKLTRLAGFKSALGRTALETLRKSQAGLESASCSCDDSSPEDLTAVSSKLASTASAAPSEPATAVRGILAALAKGLPKKRCVMPGGGG